MNNFRSDLRRTLYQEVGGEGVGILSQIPLFGSENEMTPVHILYPYPTTEAKNFPCIYVTLGDETYSDGFQTTQPTGYRSFDLFVIYYSRPRNLELMQKTMEDIEETSLHIDKAIIQSGIQNFLSGQILNFTPNSINYSFEQNAQVPYGTSTHNYTVRYSVVY